MVHQLNECTRFSDFHIIFTGSLSFKANLLSLLLSSSKSFGICEGQCNLGFCYENGIGTSKNDKQAFECYMKSAIGGDGTYKNEKKAFERYMKSAIAGYAEGQCNLGFCYENGIGTIKDNKKHLSAQNNLGACYQQLYENEIKAFEWYMKLDVLKDNIMQKIEMHKYDKTETKAFEWYMKSAIAGCAEGQCNLGCCYGNG
ncbi:hypothetical protein RhiirC2_776430 [Rhizophagus irregularis]|uniref:HCP-like protein n=1 Tax=Rhizophagus irregularis TaxID=588596 RepID=A0A2N1NGS9_9GLOM|nr:hypothetical protein RhiirC2_776430 [Rhizophagus irregularis]